MGKTFKKALAFCLLMTFILSIASTAFAAKRCVVGISGNMNKTVTFTVTTDNNWRIGYDKIKLSQSKGTMRYESAWRGYKTMNIYGRYTIYCKSNRTGRVVTNNAIWKDGGFTIYLPERNSEYTVTVKPLAWSDIQAAYIWYGVMDRWTRVPTWCITKDRGISLYSY